MDEIQMGRNQWEQDVLAELALLPLRPSWKPMKLRLVPGKLGVAVVRGRLYNTATKAEG